MLMLNIKIPIKEETKMARNIFTVDAWIVDSTGAYNKLSGYPKNFDSNNYNGDVENALKRANGDFSEVYGAFCKRDDRQIQTVLLVQANGQVIDRKSMGNFVDPVPQEPEIPEEPTGGDEPNQGEGE